MSLGIQDISLDISKQPTPQQVRLGQGDANATTLVVSVFDDGVAYDLDDYTVRLSIRLPQNGGYYNVNGTKSGNVATFDIDETYAASVSGYDGFGYVDILDGDTVICSTSRFHLVVLQNASDGVELAPQYIDAVQDAINRANAAAEAAEGVVLQDVPTMSEYVKGGALLGDGLSVSNDTLSLSGESYTSVEKTKLAGIEAGANNYTLPTMAANTKGGAKLGDGLSITGDVLSVDVSGVTGTLGVANGGTGAATHTSNAILTGNGTSALNNVATDNGAFYATAANGAAQFGTLPIAQGGTGSSSASNTTTVSSVITVGSGVSITSISARRWGPICILEINGKATADKSGTWTAGTLKTGFVPLDQVTAAEWGGNLQSRISNTGVVSINGARATDSTFSIGAAYFWKSS